MEQTLNRLGEATKGSGLALELLRPEPGTTDGFAGTVTVSQNSRRFQVGANDGQMTAVSLRNTRSWDLGKAVSNESGFNSLKDVNVLQADKATDSIRVIDKAPGGG